MRNLFTFTLCCFGLVGCSLLFQPATEELARGVVKYCDQETPEARAAYRAAVANELPVGYELHVHCPGDPE